MKKKRNLLALVLCASMILTTVSIPVYAVESMEDSSESMDTGSVCEHYTGENATGSALTYQCPICNDKNLLSVAELDAEITWPAVDETVMVNGTEYTYKGDYSSKSLNVGNSSFASTNCIFKAGDGYVLWNYATKKVTLHDATITAKTLALEVSGSAQVVVEGVNTLDGGTSYALRSSSGFSVSGTGSLKAQTSATGPFVYRIYAPGGISIDIDGDLTCGGIHCNGGALEITSDGSVNVTGLVRSTDTISITAGKKPFYYQCF